LLAAFVPDKCWHLSAAAAEGFKPVVQCAWQSCARPTTDSSEIGFAHGRLKLSEGRGRRVRISVKNQSERPQPLPTEIVAIDWAPGCLASAKQGADATAALSMS
jgi:hypothetical protein